MMAARNGLRLREDELAPRINNYEVIIIWCGFYAVEKYPIQILLEFLLVDGIKLMGIADYGAGNRIRLHGE